MIQEQTHPNGSQSQPLYEAPSSATVKVVSPNGFEVLFTIRDADAATLFRRLQALVGYMEQSGYTPPPAPQRGKGGSARRVEVPADGSAPLCPEHQTQMRASNYGGFYCAHRDQAGNYCNYKAR